jgi:hypothetical protein
LVVNDPERKTKRFLVVGHPRSGSTFLVEYLALKSGAFTPNVNHQELFNVYERLFNSCALQLDGSDEAGMLQSFFARSTKQFAGLKTIPSFHRQWRDILELPGIQFITIARRDILSSIASMLVSERTRRWDLPGREQLAGKEQFSLWFRDRRDREMTLGDLLGRLLFDLRSLERLEERPGTIRIRSEDLAGRVYESSELNAFFEQRIPIRGFKRPTDYRELFADPDSFRDMVVEFLANVLRYDTFIPAGVQSLLNVRP